MPMEMPIIRNPNSSIPSPRSLSVTASSRPALVARTPDTRPAPTDRRPPPAAIEARARLPECARYTPAARVRRRRASYHRSAEPNVQEQCDALRYAPPAAACRNARRHRRTAGTAAQLSIRRVAFEVSQPIAHRPIDSMSRIRIDPYVTDSQALGDAINGRSD